MSWLKEFRHSVWRWTWPLRSARARGLKVGQVFPEFSLRDTEGNRHVLAETFPARGAILWFTNLCEDCRSKIPLLNEVTEAATFHLNVLAVSLLGEDRALPEKVSAICRFPLLLDPEDVVGRQLGLPHPAGACPMHNLFVLDNNGRILVRQHLSAISSEKFRATWQHQLLKILRAVRQKVNFDE